MPRTLPWLTASSSKAQTSTRPAKRQKISDAAVASKASPAENKRQLPAAYLSPTSSSTSKKSPTVASNRTLQEYTPRSRPERTPSTSPPPDQPEMEYMREGLDADDIYIMVEDEFYDVAKTFTAHLHQAEYIRQRQIARERRNADIGTGIKTSVDGSSNTPGGAISREVARKKKEKETRANLSSVLSHRRSDVNGSDADRADAIDEGMRQDFGTSLHGLMVSPSKVYKSLVGLNGPTLHTRAAAGFKQAQVTPTKSRVLRGDASKLLDSVSCDSTTEEESTASEDDLNVTPTIPSRSYLPLDRSEGVSIRNAATSPTAGSFQNPANEGRAFDRMVVQSDKQPRGNSNEGKGQPDLGKSLFNRPVKLKAAEAGLRQEETRSKSKENHVKRIIEIPLFPT